MKKIRKCAFCGKEFVANSGSQKYCSEACAEVAKAAKKKRQQDFLHAVEPALELQSQEYLSFAKAAILMGCSRQYVYKLVNTGKLTASRISSRMAFIRKADIEAMLAGNPYHRVLPTNIAKESSRNVREGNAFSKNRGEKAISAGTAVTKPTDNREAILDYISSEDVMRIYKVKKSWLYVSAKRNEIPICKIAGQNYYSRKHLDELFGLSADAASVREWINTKQVEELYGMKSGAIHSYAHRHHIPTKREYGQTFYSKDHLDELRRTDLMDDDRYYTTEQVAERYGMTKANVCHIVKVHHIEKLRVGVKNLLPREDIDRVMAERTSQNGGFAIIPPQNIDKQPAISK